MSNKNYPKFKKNDFYDEEEFSTYRQKADKKRARRMDRALKVKDINEFVKDDYDRSRSRKF
jgi:hypothetical protein